MANLNLNKVILGGRISNDLELKQTNSGTAVISFNIAVNGREKQGDNYPAYFFECKAWQNTAELVSKYFRKGSSICIVGELKTHSWTDQQGNKRYKTYVNVNEVYFVDSKNEGKNEQETPAYSAVESQPRFEEVGNDDDLPF